MARRRWAADLAAKTEILRRSGVWSDDGYRTRHPDVAATDTDPARHYLTHGWRELRNPHPLFDAGWYLLENADVFAVKAEPLLHYLRFGAAEGRQPNPGFDGRWYLERNPDVAAAGVNPLVHYIRHGAAEGRWPHPLFDAAWYGERYGIEPAQPWSALAHYVQTGHAQGLMPNALFDPLWYRAVNPDVGAADLDPVAHYLTLGWRDGREPGPDFQARCVEARFDPRRADGPPLVAFLHDGAALQADVIYVGHDPSNLSHSYRVRHPVETLQAAGIRARWIQERDLARYARTLPLARVVVLARMSWSPEIERAVAACRAANVTVVFDIDDFVFDPAVANADHVDGLRFIPADDLDGYHRGVSLYRRMLLESDAVLASTPILVEAARALGKTSYLLPNGSRDSVRRASERALAGRLPSPSGRDVVIGYASGTKTHQRDFATVVPALARLMREFPHLRLQIVGMLDIAEFPDLGEFGSRIDRRPSVPVDELPFEYARFDINLAPLEIGNPYCEAKSALKFLEAGLVAVPTVASATGPFRAAIVDGETGLLATSREDWHAKLRLLVSDPERRAEMGRRARQDCAEAAPARLREETLAIFSELMASDPPPRRVRTAVDPAAAPRRPLAPGKLRIGWVVPGLIVGGGGHRNILRAAHFLQTFGHDVALYFTMDDGRTGAEFRELVRTHFYPFDGEVFVYDGRGRGEDVLLATHWTTVEPALAMRPAATEVMYFVQDFEPSFAAMSSEYVRAENTYRKGLYAITSGIWCERVLRREFGMEADHFRFPVDREVYHPRPGIERRNRIVFFAKPEMPRRCFELGAQALRILHGERPDVEIVFFGSSKARGLVDYPVTFRDVLPGIGDLAELYSGARLGMVFSTTNPSLVPYEMMACGLPVVDLDRPGNESNYDDRRDIAFLADPEPSIMARQIAALIDDREGLAARSRNGLDFVSGFPTETEMARRVEALILERVARRAGSPPRTDERRPGSSRAS